MCASALHRQSRQSPGCTLHIMQLHILMHASLCFACAHTAAVLCCIFSSGLQLNCCLLLLADRMVRRLCWSTVDEMDGCYTTGLPPLVSHARTTQRQCKKNMAAAEAPWHPTNAGMPSSQQPAGTQAQPPLLAGGSLLKTGKHGGTQLASKPHPHVSRCANVHTSKCSKHPGRLHLPTPV